MKINLFDGQSTVSTIESQNLLTAGSKIQVEGKDYIVQPELTTGHDETGALVTTQRVTLATEKGAVPMQELNE